MTNIKLLDQISIDIRWGDQDKYGHVNNTVYFRFYEEARVQWLEKNNFAVDGVGEGPVIIQAGATFLAEINYPSTVTVLSLAGEIGRSSFVINHEVVSDDGKTKFCEGFAKLVWLDHSIGKSIPIPERLIKLLAAE